MKGSFLRAVALSAILVLALTVVAQATTATLTLENIRTWCWASYTSINSVARGDVDGDGNWEIVTGGYYNDGTRNVAQLCVWNGATLALENVKTWYWTGDTQIESVALGDVDDDGNVEIVTGGYHTVSYRATAQLCVWSGDSLTLENVKTWYWIENTVINSIGVGDVDGDGSVEIVTGGEYRNAPNFVAQLCVWNGGTLSLESVKTWLWTRETYINSIAVGNVDGDGQLEVVTGGEYYDGFTRVAQLCVWNGASLGLENVQTWNWGSQTIIGSVAIGNIDSDAQTEIITGGYVSNGAQLCVWSGSSLTLQNVQTWRWTSGTFIDSVAVGDTDADSNIEIVTGGRYNDGARDIAQLCVWCGDSLTLENVKTWYWTSHTYIGSVAVGNVDSDIKLEIVTCGSYFGGTGRVAQLCVWA